MPRPESVTNEDLQQWSTEIEKDPLMGSIIMDNAILKEVCYAGYWLSKKLSELECSEHMIGQIIFTAGMICFGRKDPWAIHQDLLTKYVDGELIFEAEPQE